MMTHLLEKNDKADMQNDVIKSVIDEVRRHIDALADPDITKETAAAAERAADKAVKTVRDRLMVFSSRSNCK